MGRTAGTVPPPHEAAKPAIDGGQAEIVNEFWHAKCAGSMRAAGGAPQPQVSLAIVDLGYRGRELDDVHILHRGRAKRLTRSQRRWLKRRQAIEPTIGHLKAEHRMGRCSLKGAQGDALNAVLAAVGYNLRWLMRWITSVLLLIVLRLNRLLAANPPRIAMPTGQLGIASQSA